MSNQRNLASLNAQLKSANHPFREVTDFLLQHSNSPEYLRDNLKAALAAVEADIAEQNSMIKSLLNIGQ